MENVEFFFTQILFVQYEVWKPQHAKCESRNKEHREKKMASLAENSSDICEKRQNYPNRGTM